MAFLFVCAFEGWRQADVALSFIPLFYDQTFRARQLQKDSRLCPSNGCIFANILDVVTAKEAQRARLLDANVDERLVLINMTSSVNMRIA